MRYRCSIPDWAVLVVAGVSALVCMSRLFGFLVDDAFISFRYAENLAAGRGLVFNPGERVEGYSNLLWVLILAGANRLGLPTIATAQGLGCVAAFLALMLTFFLRRRSPAHFAALLLAASLPWALWAVSGMETLFYCLLVILAAFGRLRGHESRPWFWTSATAAGLATLTRPEGLLLALAIGAPMIRDFHWRVGAASSDMGGGSRPSIRGPKQPPACDASDPRAATQGLGFSFFKDVFHISSNRRRVILWLAVPIGFYLAQTFFRLAYYGEWLPNTYYAKSGPLLWQWSRGLERYAQFWTERGGWAVFLFPCLVGLWPAVKRQPSALLAASVFAAQSLFFIHVGGDWMALHRFLVPALPFLFLLWQTGVETLVEYGRRGALAWAGAVLLLAGAVYGGLGETLPGKESLWSYARRYAHGYREGLERTSIAVGKRLRLIAPPGARIALGDAGALPYYSGLAIIDLYGLMNRGLAHLPGHALYFDPGSFDVGTILSQRPEFVYLNSMNDYVRQRQPFQPLDHLQIDALIARNPSFVKDYRWVESAPFAPRQWCHLFARNDVELGTQRETK